MFLLEYRDSLKRFTSLYLCQLSCPNKLKRQLYPDRKVVGEILIKIEKWYKKNPDKNMPAQINETLEKAIERLYNRAQNLVRFYNDKRPIPKPKRSSTGREAEEPLYIICDFYRVFAPSRVWKPLAQQKYPQDSIGIKLPK